MSLASKLSLTIMNTTPSQEDTSRSWWKQRAPATFLGVIAISLVISLLYDFLVKPGLSEFGRVILDVLTLGSKSVKDAAYQSAALDPTPVSALILVFVLSSFVIVPVLVFFIRRIPRVPIISNLRILRQQIEDGDVEDLDEFRIEISRVLKRLEIIVVGLAIPYSIIVYIGVAVHNQSVVIWRTFHANHAIISPYIDENERLRLKSKFSSVRSKDDYLIVDSGIREIAEKHDLYLHDLELW